ncbi:rCG51569 [Rattus norvegicus]|uniref:RCG51569 n=1 Tax=Rattus norvegicus TaxID=10116 RepID=A6IYK9_RAT|nr:rCG51569 [Rattus norvegicus]
MRDCNQDVDTGFLCQGTRLPSNSGVLLASLLSPKC